MKLDINRWSIKLLYLFLATDIAFIIIHLLNAYTDLIPTPRTLPKALFFIDVDRGYAEIYQYIKEYWIALLLGLVAVRKRSFLYFVWSLLFFYLLLDDSIQVHEKLGYVISKKSGFTGWFGLRANDFGEILVSTMVGLFFLIIIATAYRFGDRFSRQACRYLITMLFILAFFGIFVDLIHMVVKFPPLDHFFIIMEDGSEMVVMSLIAGFVFLLPDQLHSETDKLKIGKALPRKILSKN